MESLVKAVLIILGIIFCIVAPVVAGLWAYIIHNHFRALSKWWWLLWFPGIVIVSFILSLFLLKALTWLN